MDKDFEKMVRGYSLVTAEILYRMPDHRNLLQSFIWQQHDVCPKLPRLSRFLDFWEENLDGPLFKVRVMHSGLIRPQEFRFGSLLRLQ